MNFFIDIKGVNRAGFRSAVQSMEAAVTTMDSSATQGDVLFEDGVIKLQFTVTINPTSAQMIVLGNALRGLNNRAVGELRHVDEEGDPLIAGTVSRTETSGKTWTYFKPSSTSWSG